MRKLMILAVVAVGASLAATVALGAAAKGTYTFKATLNPGQEVPHPKAPAGAAGTFTAKSVESSSGTTFRWTLTFHGLSGKAMAAHVHLGKKGKAGPVIVPLCGPCKSGQTGTVTIKSSVEDALEKGNAYVNVHTAKNAGGEIRGQVRMTGKS
jgi:CHRD domain-containing protein